MRAWHVSWFSNDALLAYFVRECVSLATSIGLVRICVKKTFLEQAYFIMVSEDSVTQQEAPVVARLVDQLFRAYRRLDGREYTYREVAEASAGRLAPSHLGKLRNGKVANPSRETLLELCRFFHVPPNYFFPELEHEERTAAPSAAQLATTLRSMGLQADVQESIELLVRALGDAKER